LHWVNIWRDPVGAATVRAANDGGHTPTPIPIGCANSSPLPRDQEPRPTGEAPADTSGQRSSDKLRLYRSLWYHSLERLPHSVRYQSLHRRHNGRRPRDQAS
jgi:hypothetical protein